MLEATALAFVAFTGYGRIATMGEEVRAPHRTIPRAIVLALCVSAVLYALVAAGAVAALGAAELHRTTVATGAPLEVVARATGGPVLAGVVGVAALGALCAVSLNLVLGLSRVVLAMARRGDLPRALAAVDPEFGVPRRATLAVTVVIALVAALSDLALAWSFSAFAVLVYYGITNLAALRLAPTERLVPAVVPWLGLGGCAIVATFVEVRLAAVAIATIGGALFLRALLRRRP